MKILTKGILLVFLSLVLAACTSNQKTTFYLLKSIEPISVELPTETYPVKEMTVLVKPVKFPEYLAQSQMVLRENDYKLKLSEYHRWAVPLKDNFKQVFIENLNSRIAPGNAVVYSELNGAIPDYQLSIEVLQMDVNTNNQVMLRVKWRLSLAQEAASIEKNQSEFSVTVDNNSHESGVEAQSKVIALFAEQVSETIRTNSGD